MVTAEYVPEEELELTVTADNILEEEAVLATKLMMTADHVPEEEVLTVTSECVPMEEKELTAKLMVVAEHVPEEGELMMQGSLSAEVISELQIHLHYLVHCGFYH